MSTNPGSEPTSPATSPQSLPNTTTSSGDGFGVFVEELTGMALTGWQMAILDIARHPEPVILMWGRNGKPPSWNLYPLALSSPSGPAVVPSPPARSWRWLRWLRGAGGGTAST
jgi:hypothetical protein